MPKMKTHKGSKKRMKLSASGKVRYKRSCAGHLMSGKNGGRCRAMRKKSALSGKTAKRARIVLGSS
ncbi:MAG: 50S ribosomal protein L35 [Planctomycetes bacterium]|nr:50S ribosomal protein L35 [Planctomycetota bacterium]